MENKRITIILSILVLAGLGFLICNKGKNPIINNKADSQIETKKDNLDTTFIIIPNDNLILKVERNLSENDIIFLDKRIKKYEAEVLMFNDKTSLIDKVNIYFMLSADYRTLGEYGKAKELLEKAMTLDQKNSNLMQVYSSLLAVMGDKTSALLYIDKAIILYNKESNYWLWKIDLEKDKGTESDKLESVYKNALDATGDDLNIVTVYAQFLEKKGDLQGAIEQWESAITKNPNGQNLYQAEIDRITQKLNNNQ